MAMTNLKKLPKKIELKCDAGVHAEGGAILLTGHHRSTLVHTHQPYLAGELVGDDGFCNHFYLHQRYCSIGSRAPDHITIPNSSSDDDDFVDAAMTNTNGSLVLANGHISPTLSPTMLPTTTVTTPAFRSTPESPSTFRPHIGEVHDQSAVSLYTAISASAQCSVRCRQSCSTSPATIQSPLTIALRRSPSITTTSLLHVASSSSPTLPPGFSGSREAQPDPNLPTPTPPSTNDNPTYSPISVLCLPNADPVDDEDPEEDPLEADMIEQMTSQPILQTGDRPVNAHMDMEEEEEIVAIPDGNEEEDDDIVQVVLPIFGQNLFEDVDDDAILNLIDSAGFMLPENPTDRTEIVTNLRALDEP